MTQTKCIYGHLFCFNYCSFTANWRPFYALSQLGILVDVLFCVKKKWWSTLTTVLEHARVTSKWYEINRVCDTDSHSTPVGACPQILCRIGGRCFSFVINCEQLDKLLSGDEFALDNKLYIYIYIYKMFGLVLTAAVGRAMGVVCCTWRCCSNPTVLKYMNIQTILMCERHGDYWVRPQVRAIPELCLFFLTQGGVPFYCPLNRQLSLFERQ